MNKPIRQGDVLLVPSNITATWLRENAEPIARVRGKGLVIAEGEATGHHHRIRTPRVKMYRHGPRRFVHVPRGTTGLLIHEEHSTLKIGAGVHEIKGQREYKPQAAPTRVYD